MVFCVTLVLLDRAVRFRSYLICWPNSDHSVYSHALPSEKGAFDCGCAFFVHGTMLAYIAPQPTWIKVLN